MSVGYFSTPFSTATPTEAAVGGASYTPWSSWANQVDPFNMRNARDLWSPNYQTALTTAPTNTGLYGNQSYNLASYDPAFNSQMGNNYAPDAMAYSQLVNQGIDQANQRLHPELYSGFTQYGTSSNPGAVTSLGGDWAKVDTWTQQIQQAVKDVYNTTGVYVPPNFVKAIMKLESGGDPTSRAAVPAGQDPSTGAYGLMQVMPGIWGDNPWHLNINDPAQNIALGVHILADNYNQGDPSDPNNKSWEWAAKRYLGLGGPDAYGTDANTYWDVVSKNWSQLQQGFDQTSGAGGAPPAGTKQFSSIWGGIDAPISQGFGLTDFAQQQLASGPNNEYAYSADYSLNHQPIGHAGMDVAVSYGTRLYSPIAGTISIIGSQDGQNYYYTSTDANGNDMPGPNRGELAITEPNGDVLILGHMSDIKKADGSYFHVGDQVTPGEFVGFSGSQGTGAHVHVEYRRWLGPNGAGNGPGQTTSGYVAIDPSQALSGDFSGVYGQAATGGPSYVANPGNYGDFLRAVMSGQPYTTKIPTNVGGFHDYLFNALMHKPQIEQQSSPIWMWANGGTGADASTQQKTG